MNKVQFTFLIVCFVQIECQYIDINDNTPPKTGVKDDGRIIGGYNAAPGEFVGMVSLQYLDLYLRKHFCGGTLINASVVLTAAHCVIQKEEPLDPKDFVVLGDDVKVNGYLKANPHRQFRNVTTFVVHKEYNATLHKNDIALILLEKPFLLTATFGPVNVTDVAPVENEPCRTAGWGLDYETGEMTTDDLKAINISIIPMKICNGTTSYNGIIPDSALCAGVLKGGRDACIGDSGGGLICGGVVKGIVAFGSSQGCAWPKFPAGYTNVYRFKDWIKNNSIAILADSSGHSVTSIFAITTLTILLVGIMKVFETLF